LTKKQKDSTTKVYLPEKRFKGERKVVSFRCNKKLFLTFKQQMKADGNTVCHVLEAMISAVLGAYPQLVNNRNTITIENLHVKRNVLRHRRVSHEFESQVNKYDSSTTTWIYDADSALNVHGHAAGCTCKVCREGVDRVRL